MFTIENHLCIHTMVLVYKWLRHLIQQFLHFTFKKKKKMFLVHVSHMGFKCTILMITGNEESGDDLLDDLTGCAGTLRNIAHTIYKSND